MTSASVLVEESPDSDRIQEAIREIEEDADRASLGWLEMMTAPARGAWRNWSLYRGVKMTWGIRPKITYEDAEVIRRRWEKGETQVSLASDFGVSQRTISAIVRRESHTLKIPAKAYQRFYIKENEPHA